MGLVAFASIFLAFGGVCLAETPGQGGLTIIEPDGKPGQGCPLQHTSVKAEISGFVARVSVTQQFHNPRKEKVEAVYTFPLSSDAAVDEMIMRVGERTVRGVIKRRDEARRIYEDAKDRGRVASLLDQERPNIFTQSVANIMPGEKVEITIQYSELLPYEDASFRFVFPMVVGPRFIPGRPVGSQGTGWAPDTTSVPDASRITPPVTPAGARAGHDISLSVSIDAGVPILGIESKLHEVEVERKSPNRATISLRNQNEIPNRDFVLKYVAAGDEVRSGALTHKTGADGYVTIIMIPPKRVTREQIAPREMIFVIDCSGSQYGKPLEKAKDAMRYFIDHMNPKDTFNIIDFNEGSRTLFSEPKPNTPENREKALNYLRGLEARGGTWMGPAVEKIAMTPAPENRLRIVSFMTDGYVGNDFEIISLVKRLRGASRWFPFGTGNSVNRFLLDQMARSGGGEPEYILLNSPGEQVAAKFYDRIAEPVLTNVSLDVKGIELQQIYPEALSDLWSRKLLVFKARYSKPGKGTITIKGFASGKPYEQTLNVDLPEHEPANPTLASLWARSKVDDLMDRDWMNIQRGTPLAEIKEEIVKVGLDHKIMTQFTSFVAVEETVVTINGKPTTVAVPVEMPEGVSRDRIFGDKTEAEAPTSLSTARVRAYGPLSAMVERKALGAPQMAVAPSAPASEEKGRRVEGVFLDAKKREAVRSEEDFSEPPSKLSPELRDLGKLMKAKAALDFTHGAVRVEKGKVIVQVWLESMTADDLELLKKTGLEISFTATGGKTVMGSIAVEKLEELAKLKSVKFVEPLKA
jgi:Ca-activated chloride channel family protein